MKVLVVDDEEDIQLLFKEKFRKEIKSGQIEFLFALSGETALDYLKKQEEESVVLVLSDIRMPGMDGLELLKIIKQNYPKLKVFMITAYGDEQKYQTAMTYGADDYITKPVNFDSLKKDIQLIANLQQLIKDLNEPPKILVVDDEPAVERLINQAFRRKIRAQEYQFFFSHNGIEALEKLRAEPNIDIVLTDINMPGMDGLTLLSKINQINPTIKTVIVSAYGDMKNIRTAMNGGAFDFLTKPIDIQDLEVTINKTLTHVKQLKENLHLRRLEAIARAQAQQLKKSLQELQQNQAQLILTAKMSSLGQLVAGIAHEINNPVGFIYSNLDHVSEYMQDLLHLLHIYQRHYPNPISEVESEAEAIDLEFLNEDLPKILTSMKVGTDRIREIVLSLRNFSRLDEAKMKLVDIHSGIDNTLQILQHRLRSQAGVRRSQAGAWERGEELPAIQVIKEYGKLPLVECYAGELNQVFMNILTNAIDALDESNKQRSLNEICQQPSTITIRTHVLEDNSRVVIQIRDNGMGMTAAVKDRIFEPFFTTKSVGHGTGLGLFVSYQIVVEKHGGVLKCFSEPGQGADLRIEIPVKQNTKMVTKGVKNESNGCR